MIPTRERLDPTRPGKTHHFTVAGHDGYLTVNTYPDGRVGEIFLRMAKEGSTVSGFADVVATCISLGVQHGIPLAVYCRKLRGWKFEPMGVATGDADIAMVGSIVDYVAKYLAKHYCPDEPIEPGFGLDAEGELTEEVPA
jgi:ribonucleoside-diphosphate reductase alpha chain